MADSEEHNSRRKCSIRPRMVNVNLTVEEHGWVKVLADNVGLYPAPYMRWLLHRMWKAYQKELGEEAKEVVNL